MTAHRHTSFGKRLACALALAIFGLTLPLSSYGHEAVAFASKRADGRSDVLPIFLQDQHLVFTPQQLDFGTVLVGESPSLTVSVHNLSMRDVEALATAPSGFTVVPSTFSLAAGGTAQVQVTFSPTQAVSVQDAIIFSVSHDGVGQSHQESLPVTAEAFVGSVLQLKVDGMPVEEEVDFGFRTRRFYEIEEAPALNVTIENVGDLPADFDIEFSDHSVLAGTGCTLGGNVVCFFNADGITKLQEQTIPAGGSLLTVWRLFPGWVADIELPFVLETGHQDFEVTVVGSAIAAFMDPATFIASTSAGSAETSSPPDDWQANTDPDAFDPLGAFRPSGFDPRSVLSVGELDVVDLQTGYLTFTVPIGEPQHVRGDVSYQLSAVYSSNSWARRTMWDLEDVLPCDATGPCPPGALRMSRANAEYPDPLHGMAFGWMLHLGRLLPPTLSIAPEMAEHPIQGQTWQDIEKVVDTGSYYTFVTPDGARHKFSYHLNQPRSPHDPLNGGEYYEKEFLYARDGSYLRLHQISSSERHVQFPDGTYRVFRTQQSLPASERPDFHPDIWLLTRIADRYCNEIRIDYSQASQWIVRDNGADSTPCTQDPEDEAWRETTIELYPGSLRVKKVTMPGFKGLAENERVYDFNYTPLSLDRPGSSLFHRDVVGGDTSVSVHRLNSITQPDDTLYDFSYDEDLRMTEADLPTGAQVEWEQGSVYTELPDCTNNPVIGFSLFDGRGVTRRTVTGRGGNVLADTRYLRQQRRAPEIPIDVCMPVGLTHRQPGPFTDQIVAVWKLHQTGSEKLSSIALNYFSIWPVHFGPGDWSNRDRNLPFTRAETHVDPDLDELFLSTRLFECGFNLSQAVAASTEDPFAGDDVLGLVANSQCEELESQWVKYRVAIADHCNEWGSTCNVGRRLQRSKTFYENDAPGDNVVFATIDKSDDDGLGHYRSSVTGGNFSEGNIVERFKNWNPDAGTLVLDDDGNVVVDIDEPEPWILGTYREDWVLEGGVKMGKEAVFDSTNGWLRLERIWEGDGPGPKDVVVRHTRDGHGQLAIQRFFGADTYSGAGLTAGDWDDAGQEGTYWAGNLKDYGIEYEYEFGRPSRQKVIGSSIYEVWRDVDQHTGWTLEETRNSGEELVFDYDKMGRIRSIDSELTADQTFDWSRVLSQGVETWKLVAKTFQNGGTSHLTRYQAEYDELGRIGSEAVQHPDGTDSIQTTTYHPSGSVAAKSMIDAPSKSMKWIYDARGRVREQRSPDNSKVVRTYSGVRAEQIRSAVNGVTAINAATRLIRDRQGRVIDVERGSFSSGQVTGLHRTFLSYDPLGQLVEARRQNQVRNWQYDGRGFMLSEDIPEREARAVYSDFDTRGNAGETRDKVSSATVRTTTRLFDDLGRPTELKVGGDVIKAWSYGSCDLTGVGDDLGNCPSENGQLLAATRNNFRTAADTGGLLCTGGSPCSRGRYTVTSELDEFDDAGRPTSRKTRVTYTRLDASGGVIGESDTGHFGQSWSYDDLGNVTGTDYPKCVSPTPSCTGARSVTAQYTRGVLTKVVEPGLGATLKYHPGFSVKQVIHDLGGGQTLADDYDADPDGLARVSSISLAGQLTLGPYAYDGTGNITSIDGVDDSYVYDVNSRLTSASLLGGAHTFGYSYDPFDNLQFGTVSQITNQLEGGGNAYDVFGNWTDSPIGQKLIYDELDKLKTMFDNPDAVASCDGTDANCTISIYDAADLRVLRFRHGEGFTWTLRDLDGKTLSTFSGLGGGLDLDRDYTYAGKRVIASRDVQEARDRHYHLDHLGTARVISSPGLASEIVHYDPFGGDLVPASDERVAGFTGHEQEIDGPDGANRTTYMRARQYFPAGGRFMQVDPARDRAAWSLYAYAANNPGNAIDRSGLAVWYVSRQLGKTAVRDTRNPLSHSYVAVTNEAGTVIEAYSWGNNGFVGFWHEGVESDISTAQAAIDQGKARPEGDDSLDPYVSLAYAQVSQDAPHPNGLIVCNCKWEAAGLIVEAQRLRAQAGAQNESAEKRWLREQRQVQKERRRAHRQRMAENRQDQRANADESVYRRLRGRLHDWLSLLGRR